LLAVQKMDDPKQREGFEIKRAIKIIFEYIG
jgi:hypothetical protein